MVNEMANKENGGFAIKNGTRLRFTNKNDTFCKMENLMSKVYLPDDNIEQQKGKWLINNQGQITVKKNFKLGKCFSEVNNILSSKKNKLNNNIKINEEHNILTTKVACQAVQKPCSYYLVSKSSKQEYIKVPRPKCMTHNKNLFRNNYEPEYKVIGVKKNVGYVAKTKPGKYNNEHYFIPRDKLDTNIKEKIGPEIEFGSALDLKPYLFSKSPALEVCNLKDKKCAKNTSKKLTPPQKQTLCVVNQSMIESLMGAVSSNLKHTSVNISKWKSSKFAQTLQKAKLVVAGSSAPEQKVFNGKMYNKTVKSVHQPSRQIDKDTPASGHRNTKMVKKVTCSKVQNWKLSGTKQRFKGGTLQQKLKSIKDLVNEKKLEKKTFTIIGNFPTLRRALLARGWIEKVKMLRRLNHSEDCENYQQLEQLSNLTLVEGMAHPVYGEGYKRVLITKLLHDHQVDFYWDYFADPFLVNSDNIKQTFISRYPPCTKRPYDTKEALADTINTNSHWYCKKGESNILFPRTYNLSCEYEKKEFIKDFKITAVISLINWVANTTERNSSGLIYSCNIPQSLFKFALHQCENYLKLRKHKDIDETVSRGKEYDWVKFLEEFYQIFHNYNNLKRFYCYDESVLIQSRNMIKELEPYWPNLNIDGYMDLWIMKPHRGGMGRGIIICRTLNHVLSIIKKNQYGAYVIQKYIERPLLIYHTKFDIRQWFVVTHQPKLHVWMFRDCYLRFSSQYFNLYNLHEAIHITNNAIQQKYDVQRKRHEIPSYNMWHSDRFKKYLADNGKPKAWKNIIYNGMKQCMIGVIMCGHEKMSNRVNSFELWGVDFLLGEDLNPYIIEINSKPALCSSTVVTAELCTEVMRDLIKVIVDYAEDPRSPTGKFELIYKDQNNLKALKKQEENLCVNGINYFYRYKI